MEKPKEVLDLINRSLLAKKLGMAEEAIALNRLALQKYSLWRDETKKQFEYLTEWTEASRDKFAEWADFCCEALEDLTVLEDSFCSKNQNWIAIAHKYQGVGNDTNIS